MREIIIFGAGRYGKLLKQIIESNHIKKEQQYKVCYFCDNYITEGVYIDGVKVLHPYSLEKIRGGGYDIIISTSAIVDDVMKQLKELGVSDKVYLVPDYTYKFMWNNETMPFLIPMDIKKPRLPYLECKIVEHCNLKCNGCSVCANINEPNYIELEKFERDLIQLRQLYAGIKYLKLFGGEPLLHPRLVEIMELARKYFQDSELVVHSNGLLVPTLSTRILDCMRKLNIKFVFTLYPETGRIKRNIEMKLGKNSVEYEFTPPVYEFRKLINIKGDYNSKEIYQNCCKCINLIDGTLSCGMPFFIEKLEKTYSVDICRDKFEHCVDIYKTELDGWQINKLLDSPYNLCAYCAFMRFNVMDDDYYYKWKSENPKLEDWTF